jgi:hypothetical protein
VLDAKALKECNEELNEILNSRHFSHLKELKRLRTKYEKAAAEKKLNKWIEESVIKEIKEENARLYWELDPIAFEEV